MSLYIIGDTHLSSSGEKTMEVFGSKWENYTERLEKNWRSVVSESDNIIIAGDVSWGMNLADAKEDFDFLNKLPGNKYIIKGNHDYWWDTVTKMNRWCMECGYFNIHFIHNTAYKVENYIICGSRGWFSDEEKGTDTEFNKKILARETGRLKLSLAEAERLRIRNPKCEKIAVLHYPPVYGDYICDEIMEVLVNENISHCFFGHIHNASSAKIIREYRGIHFELISGDYISFHPKLIEPGR